MKTGRKGFTLIELLVVIAIIAILAAILFPVFISAKDKAKSAACLNNEKQIGSAMMLYLDDWNQTYPTIGYKGWAGQAGAYPWPWTRANELGVLYPLQPYLKNKSVKICPSSIPYPAYPKVQYCSYNVNSYRIAGQTEFQLWGFLPSGCIGNRAATLSEVRRPTKVVAMHELKYRYIGDANPGFYDLLLKTGVHSGGMNFIFADGHARWYNTESLPRDLDRFNSGDWPEMGISFRKDF